MCTHVHPFAPMCTHVHPPPHAQEERRRGYFDEGGNYVERDTKDEDDVDDAWLKSDEGARLKGCPRCVWVWEGFVGAGFKPLLSLACGGVPTPPLAPCCPDLAPTPHTPAAANLHRA